MQFWTGKFHVSDESVMNWSLEERQIFEKLREEAIEKANKEVGKLESELKRVKR